MGNIEIVHSQSHLLFPKIIIFIVGLLGLALIIQRFLSSRKINRKFLNLGEFTFFEENIDKIKFFGTIIGLAIFVLLMQTVGFIVGSFVGLSILNIIYNGWGNKKTIIKSLIISLIETLVVWYLFSNIFGVTLP